jgi:hypothetical protein
MSTDNSHESLCLEVERRLSAFVDGELTVLERLGAERHLETCAACRRELELLTAVSSLLRGEGRSVPEPPAWESVRETLATSRPPRSIWRGFIRAMAASIALVALAGLSFAIARLAWPSRTEPTIEGFQALPVQLAGLPGLERFLADHRAEEVKTTDLGGRVSFAPQMPEELPGGFRLQTAYVVRDRCCTGSCLIYRRGDELVTLVQHPPSHPVSWRSGALENCTVAGLACRRARGREVDLLQIEPEGRNLTLVTRAGAVDLAVFVRALSGG